MSILQFQYVLNLAKFQDFETVSEKYFISQSTLNTMVIKFEDEIGFPIFLLPKKPLQITEAVNRQEILSRDNY